jgi:uncharacterized SAM-binding protein YcdF (DUF218 family)
MRPTRVPRPGSGSLEKAFATLLLPSGFLALLCAATALAVLAGWRRAGRRLAALLLTGLGALMLLPLDDWLLLPLENRFPPPVRYPERVDGVVVLANGPKGRHLRARDEPSIDEPNERFTALVELATRFPHARLVFTGGSGRDDPEGASEAEAARVYYERLGFDTGRILFEDRARNTFENAKNSFELVRPKPGEVWLLVTSARDMPRAVGVFRALGWDVQPWPVDYITEGRFLPVRLQLSMGRRLVRMDVAAYEWYALVWYWWTGRLGELFPGPAAGPGGERGP